MHEAHSLCQVIPRRFNELSFVDGACVHALYEKEVMHECDQWQREVQDAILYWVNKMEW